MDDVLRHMGAGMASSFDRAVHAFALSRSERSRRRSRSESLGPQERADALRQLATLYSDPEYYTDPDTFFPVPATPSVTEKRARRYGRAGEVIDLSWPSDYRTFLDDVTERYHAVEENGRAHARAFFHRDGPRPAVILVHGYLAGRHAVEERMWPVEWMFRRGLDPVLAVLPFHAVRGRGGMRYRPPFPHADPRLTIEGFRQATGDLRALLRWLEERGAPAVGLMGMSLGGYTTALLATVEPKLSFAVPFIPLASIADFARDNGRLIGTPEQQLEQHALLEEVYRPVSPFARAARVPREGRLVVAGAADRITPVSHAERLAGHLEAPLEQFPGGHLLQVGRGRAFRAIARMWGQLGLLPPRRPPV